MPVKFPSAHLLFSQWTAILVAIFLLPLVASGQLSNSVLRGTVSDSSGAVIPGASVTLFDAATGVVVRKAATDAQGNFEFPDLTNGSYNLHVEKQAFETRVINNIVLDAGQTRRVDAHMQVGSASERVEVNAGAAVIETQTGTTSEHLSEAQLTNSPVGDNFPDPHAYVATLPSVQSDSSGYGVTIHGLDSNQQSEAMDGSPSDRVGTNIDLMVFSTHLDVVTSNADADSAVPVYMNSSTKSGTDQWHGSASYKMINNGLNSASYQGPGPVIKDKLIIHQGQAELSGPIWKKHTFFYISYWLERINQDTPLYATLPTAAMRSGDFTGFQLLKDPTTGKTFESEYNCNCIPTSRQSSVALNAESYYPGLTSSAPYGSNNFNWIHPYVEDAYKMDYLPVVRVDQTLSDKNTLYAVWHPRTSPYILSQSLPLPFAETLQWNTWQLNVNDTHVFTPTLVNNARFSATHENYNVGPSLNGVTPVEGETAIDKIGLQGIPSQPNVEGFPGMTFTGTGMAGATPTSISESSGGLYRRRMDFSYGDDVIWSRGRHVIKAGGDILTFSQYAGDVPNYGSFTFNGFFTGVSYADFLLGLPYTSSRESPLIDRTALAKQLGFFAEDTFKMTPKLTVSYGLRWDYYGAAYYSDGLQYTFDPASTSQYPDGAVVIQASKKSLVSSLYPSSIPLETTTGSVTPKESLLNLRPRLSVAYQLPHNAVIRGAYGQYTERIDPNYTSYVSDPGPFNHLAESYTNCLVAPGTSTCSANQTGGSSLFSFPSPFPDTASNPVSASSQSVEALPHEWHNGVIHQYNLQIEKQLGRNGLRIGYFGTRGVGLNYDYNANLKPANATPYDPSLRPWPIFNGVTVYQHDGSSHYDALEVEASRRTTAFTFDVNYTWASSINNLPFINNNYFGGQQYLEELNTPGHRPWQVDEGLRRNDFVANVLYSLPFGTGQHFLSEASHGLNEIVGGWTVESVTRLASPTYETALMGSAPYDVANDGYNAQLPTLIPGQSPNLPSGQRTRYRYWNSAVYHTTTSNGTTQYVYDHLGAFAYPGAPADDPLCLNAACQQSSYFTTGVGPGVYGNACIGCLRTQGLVTQHLNVAKTFPVTEKVNMRYTASFLNLFNHPHFYDPSPYFDSSTYSQMLYAYGSDIDFFSDKSGYRKIEMGLSVNF